MPVVVHKLVTDQDIGNGLKIEGGKLHAEGYKNASVDGNTLVLTKVDNTEQRVELPAPTVDVKLAGAKLINETTLELTLSNDEKVTVDLAKFLNIDTDTKPVSFAWGGTDNLDLVMTLSDNTTVSLTVRGAKAQSLGGTDLGYFVAL